MTTLDLVLILTLCAISVITAGSCAFVVLRVHFRKHREHALDLAVDHGVLYAEQMGKRRAKEKSPQGPSQKFNDALHVASDELKAKGIDFTAAELGRRIEVRCAKR